MSISYQDIINVLCNNKNNFSTNLNIMCFVDQFKYFTDIFDNQYYRYGIYNYNNNYENISFISSILYCLDDNYFIVPKAELFEKINNIKKELKSKEDIVKKLCINILIFDFKENKIKSIYGGDYFNPYKETIFLAKYEEYWEPICCKEYKTFNINNSKSNTLKNKLLGSDIEYLNNSKVFIVNDNVFEIAENEFPSNENNDESFITKNNMLNNLTKNKLNKMSKNDIIQIINDLNIDIKNLKKPTKVKLIEIILSQ